LDKIWHFLAHGSSSIFEAFGSQIAHDYALRLHASNLAGRHGLKNAKFCPNSSQNCPGKDSNLHAAKHQILSLACLPIPPPGRLKKHTVIEVTRNDKKGKLFICHQLGWKKREERVFLTPVNTPESKVQDAALGIVTNPNDDVLLILRNDVPFWVLPGGGIDKNELPSSACFREIHEETGLCIDGLVHIATYSPINALATNTYVYGGLCSKTSQLRLQPDEVREASFFSLNNLPKNLFFLHEHILQDWKTAKALPFTRSLTEITYKNAIRFLCKHPISSLKYLWTRLVTGYASNPSKKS
jgi:8-oxo-dGTP diphosphatase